jgi:hypothetical protein
MSPNSSVIRLRTAALRDAGAVPLGANPKQTLSEAERFATHRASVEQLNTQRACASVFSEPCHATNRSSKDASTVYVSWERTKRTNNNNNNTLALSLTHTQTNTSLARSRSPHRERERAWEDVDVCMRERQAGEVSKHEKRGAVFISLFETHAHDGVRTRVTPDLSRWCV